ncbi:MAG: T9SS type A sorting domain-containing protein [Bacteroidales bacterium]|nr:T9SS type A sorting domain-containing protein [Bacteroidales bacterium]
MKKVIVVILYLLLTSLYSQAQQINSLSRETNVDVFHDVSPPLREMKILEPGPMKERWENDEIPNNPFFIDWDEQNRPLGKIYAKDPVVQEKMGPFHSINAILNFEGLTNVNTVNPADPNGDVGLNYYIQTINISFAIYTKTGALAYGPANLKTIWQGFPGTYTSDGDPIVLFDHLANRWLISQFSLPNYPSGPFYELIAVSQTEDPLGAWNRYAFKFKNMPDYPKLGVWPDGYYLSANTYSTGALNWMGPLAVVLERDSMLTGGSARMVSFQQNKSLGLILTADLDGQAPPKGTPGYFLMPVDDASGTDVDQLQLFQLHVDWADTSKSSFTGPFILNTAAFDMKLCGNNNDACIHQKGTGRRLVSLSYFLMYRLQYRNFGAHQSMVVNQTVDADNTTHAGVRWYELRKTSSDWTIYQQGTYAPDSLHRWMGSAAMDGNGNIALGYSVSGDSLFPSIAITGRRVGDPPGQMTCREEMVFKGLGSQTTESRWGDYSSLSVDPSDDKTFWYTNMYCPSTSQRNWTTRVASFTINDLQVNVGESLPAEGKSNHLRKIFPNPLSQSTILEWTLTRAGAVKIQVLDLNGKLIATPVNASEQASGDYHIDFDASGIAAGIYICRFSAGDIFETQKLVVVK